VKSIWIAPLANPQTCYGQATQPSPGAACGTGRGTEFGDHVHLAGQNGYDQAPIFDDLYGCNLPKISWVIPDLNWSDHANSGFTAKSTVYGPAWVGDIIDGVGQACGGMYWNTEPTAVIVIWDDWGGWYDHVYPWAYYRGTSTSCPTTDAPNGWGCGYVSGFRVPLLVVSPYTGTGNAQTGYSTYVSGKCGASPLPSCPNFGTNHVYVHDFGSILAFTEYNFGMPFIDGPPDDGYADYNAPDWGPNRGNVPLSDFFGLYPNPRPFVSITTDETYTYFEGANSTLIPGYPGDPDDDTD
jgi:hypothetical protein